MIPTLDESALRALASKSGGRYARLSLDDDDLERLLSDTLPDVGNATLALDRTADAWEDKGYLLILLLLPVALSLFRRGWVVCLLPLLFLGSPQQASAQSWDDLWLTPDQQGQKALESGDNEAAVSLFENPDWQATAAYRNEDFERATKQFSETETPDSWYNRGNALAKAGELDKAIAAYKQSLELQPEKSDAIENIELLEKMKEQQEQQEQEQQDQDQDDENQEQQDQENQDKQDQSDEQEPSDEQSDPSDSDQDGEQEQEPQQDEESEQEQDQEEDQEQDSEQEEPAEQDEQEQQAEQAQPEEPSEEDKEKEQAMEQWLRRIPDDPSGLLREKFRYESRQREQEGDRRKNEKYW